MLRQHGFAVPVAAPSYSGVPDVAYAIPRSGWYGAASGWLELKYLPAWPQGALTPVRLPQLRAAQVRWLVDWSRAGGNADLLLRVGADCVGVPGRHAERVARGLTRGQLLALPGAARWPCPPLATAFLTWLTSRGAG